MTPVSKTAEKILDRLTSGLAEFEAKKIDNTSGSFMPVSVERLNGNVFSIAHYYVQNGDLMADPEMTFLKTALGWHPLTFTQANLGLYQEACVLNEDQSIKGIRQRLYNDLRVFTTQWMRNIKSQQLDS